MLRLCLSGGILAATVLTTGIPARAGVTDKWVFQHGGNRFRGVIALEQTGPDVRGTWHTGTLSWS